MEIIDKITISAPPQKVYDTLVFFFRSADNYRLWHRDHVSCYWKKGQDFSPGSVLIAEEYLHEKVHKMGFKIITREPGKRLGYKMLFPFSLICSGGSFSMIPKGEETELIASLRFRNGFLSEKHFRKNIEAVRQHMKEEGIALRDIIEKDLIVQK